MTFGGARRESFLVSGYGLVEFGLDLAADLILVETHTICGRRPTRSVLLELEEMTQGETAILKQ